MGMMKYVEGLLGKNEQILWRARQHWIVLSANFVINLFIFVVIWAIYGAAGMLGSGWLGDFLRNNRGFALILLLIPICWFGWEFLQWWAEEYLVTTHRVVQTEGLINKHTKDSALEKINDITLNQSFLGRILGYGDLAIITGSDVGTNVLKRLAKPVEFKKTLLEQKSKLSDGEDLGPHKAAVAAEEEEDPLKKIAQLDELRKSGAISEVEYQQAKAKLLAKL
ncbi:MAG TPA: PH domain-containing protein [Anaerolineae bacterium]|nr:PH domain-containing protein [Anaerolineae bacterium]